MEGSIQEHGEYTELKHSVLSLITSNERTKIAGTVSAFSIEILSPIAHVLCLLEILTEDELVNWVNTHPDSGILTEENARMLFKTME